MAELTKLVKKNDVQPGQIKSVYVFRDQRDT